jgi:2-polyprenyl-3-methyl-5-hydroxy-6-metoxy-1,4-benzoquinol methylase
VRKFEWSQVKEFYEARSSHWQKFDPRDDPDALRNIVVPGAPLWFARYFARSQEMAYQALFDLIPAARPPARALDIGCGAGRWTRFLSEHGYQAIGIDLQPALIEAARRRYSHIDFLCTSLQEYSPEEPFDLVSSVEVLQHNPFEEQENVIRKIRESLTDGGYVIMLEGIGEDPRAWAFFRAIDSWIEAFEKSGFRTIALQRYSYHPVLKLSGSVRRQLASMLTVQKKLSRDKVNSDKEDLDPEAEAAIPEAKGGYLHGLAKRMIVGLDAPVEFLLLRSNRDILTPSNCGFLFQAS